MSSILLALFRVKVLKRTRYVVRLSTLSLDFAFALSLPAWQNLYAPVAGGGGRRRLRRQDSGQVSGRPFISYILYYKVLY